MRGVSCHVFVHSYKSAQSYVGHSESGNPDVGATSATFLHDLLTPLKPVPTYLRTRIRILSVSHPGSVPYYFISFHGPIICLKSILYPYPQAVLSAYCLVIYGGETK